MDNLTETIKTLEEENASMKLLLNNDEANVWQKCSRTIKIRDILSTLNFISTSKFSPLQQLQIDDTQLSHTSQMSLITGPPSLKIKSHPKYNHQNINLHQVNPHLHVNNTLHIMVNCNLLNNMDMQQLHLYYSNLDHIQFQHKQ